MNGFAGPAPISFFLENPWVSVFSILGFFFFLVGLPVTNFFLKKILECSKF